MARRVNCVVNVTLPWPDPALSPNARNRWKRAEASRVARMLARMTTQQYMDDLDKDYLRNAKPSARYKLGRVFIPPDARGYDLDNLVTRCKPYLDGIFDALGLDDRAIVRDENDRQDPGPEPGVTLTLWEV